MKRTISVVVVVLLGLTVFICAQTPTAAAAPRFEVTVTNLTRGQQFTPILVASHQEGVRLFTLGSPASSELATLAEEGNTGPLEELLLSTPRVGDIATSAGLLSSERSGSN